MIEVTLRWGSLYIFHNTTFSKHIINFLFLFLFPTSFPLLHVDMLLSNLCHLETGKYYMYKNEK